MAFNIRLNKKLANFSSTQLQFNMRDPELLKQLKEFKLVREETTMEDYDYRNELIGTKDTGWDENFLVYSTIAKAIKEANPGMSNVDFTDFGFSVPWDNWLSEVKNTLTKGQKYIPKVQMRVLNKPDISRRYNEDSKSFVFTLNAPDINDVVAEAITVENLSELTWDDYEKVKTVLEGFGNGLRALEVKEVSDSEDSRYLHLVLNSRDDISTASLFSVTMDWNNDLRAIPLLSFHFTRAGVENKETIVLENSNIRINKDPLLEDNR